MGGETFLQTSKHDKNPPQWILSTVHYVRWGWGELEPQPGISIRRFLDKVLKETHASGQKLAFGVMCCSTMRKTIRTIPNGKGLAARKLIADYEGHGPFPIPDMDDPIV